MTDGRLRVLVFTRTCGYRHESTTVAVAALERVASERGWFLEATDDAGVFTERLAERDVVVFLSTAGTVLDAAQKLTFERWARAGKGFAGIHGATNTEYDWPLYGRLVGAYFRAHPAIQPATVVVEDAEHPATRMFPARFSWVDEWYAFVRNPRPNVRVLLTLDESSYAPGADGMGGDHPVAWCHEVEGVRAFYTALGHTDECWDDPLFLAHVVAGIEWAGG